MSVPEALNLHALYETWIPVLRHLAIRQDHGKPNSSLSIGRLWLGKEETRLEEWPSFLLMYIDYGALEKDLENPKCECENIETEN